MKTLFNFSAFLLGLLLLSSCNSDEPSFNCDQTLVFDIDLFIQELNSELQSDYAGYQIAVNQGGNLYYNEAFGFARHEDEPGGGVPMTINTRQNVASVSKFIGTIALMKALEDNGIHPDSTVVNYLPDSWRSTVHGDFSDKTSPAYLTFNHLLTNNTAIDFLGGTPPSGSMLSEADMLASLQRPPNMQRYGVYQNANFTLIRVLIGEIVYNLDETGLQYPIYCPDRYFHYLRENIFHPLEIYAPLSPQAVDSYYNTSDFPLAYAWPFNTNPGNNGYIGWIVDNNPLNVGSSGLLLSARDLAKVLAIFKYDDQGLIISNTQRDRIFNGTPEFGPLGLTTTFEGERGTYFAKNGAKSNDPCGSCDRALRSIVIYFPNDVEVALLVNYNRNTPRLRFTIADIYESSFVEPCP